MAPLELVVAARVKELRFETRLDGTGGFRGAGGAARARRPGRGGPRPRRRSLLLAREPAPRAGRLGVEVGATREASAGTVTRRDEDGRYAFVEVDVESTRRSIRRPTRRHRTELATAPSGCFVGASLTAKPALHLASRLAPARWVRFRPVRRVPSDSMQRLRHLTEQECYTRIYGDRDDTVRVVGSKVRESRFPTLSGETLRELLRGAHRRA